MLLFCDTSGLKHDSAGSISGSSLKTKLMCLHRCPGGLWWVVDKLSKCSASLTAERPQLVGRLPEGDAAPAPAHHDHDEDGSLPSGESTSLTYRCSTQKIHSLQVYSHVWCNLNPPRRRQVTPSLSATKSASLRPSTTAWGTPGSRGWSSTPTATSMTILPQGRSLPTYHLELVRGKKKPLSSVSTQEFGVEYLFRLLPSGRHRCIGENFAYVQIKTIWSTLLRMYEFDLVDGYFPTINYTTMIHTPHNPVIRYKRRHEWRSVETFPTRKLEERILNVQLCFSQLMCFSRDKYIHLGYGLEHMFLFTMWILFKNPERPLIRCLVHRPILLHLFTVCHKDTLESMILQGGISKHVK